MTYKTDRDCKKLFSSVGRLNCFGVQFETKHGCAFRFSICWFCFCIFDKSTGPKLIYPPLKRNSFLPQSVSSGFQFSQTEQFSSSVRWKSWKKLTEPNRFHLYLSVRNISVVTIREEKKMVPSYIINQELWNRVRLHFFLNHGKRRIY